MTRIGILNAMLGENLTDDVAVDVSQAVVAALVFEGEAGVVDAEEVEDRGVEIVDVDGVGGDVVGEVVGLAEGEAGFYSRAGEKDGEAAGVVVAAVVFGCERALAINRAAEFAAPDDEGVV